LATQPDYGTFYASADKSTGDYAIDSVNNNAAKTVTSDTHLYTAHMCGPVAGLPFHVGGELSTRRMLVEDRPAHRTSNHIGCKAFATT
jgi:hypothetical protein